MPKKVKAKITRLVVEIAFIELENDGTVRDYNGQHNELDGEVIDVIEVLDVIKEW